jgi:hypothetical protein
MCRVGSPNRQAHLALTPATAIDTDSRIASLGKPLNDCDLHFSAALTCRTFCTSGL